MKKAILAALAILLGAALGVPASSADAHAYLSRSTPRAGDVLGEAPTHVLLYFSEDIEVPFSRAQLIDATGQRYDNGDFHQHSRGSEAGFTTIETFPNGTYTIVWDVLSSVDGHRTKGTVPFFVGPPPDPSAAPPSVIAPELGGSGAPDWLEVIARWSNFAGMAALIGAATFPFLVLARGFRARSDALLAVTNDAEAAAWSALRTSTLVAMIVVLAASLASLWLQVWAASGSASSTSLLDEVLFDTRFGEIWTVRAGILMIVGIIAILLPRVAAQPWRESILSRGNTRWLLLAVLAIALPATTSLNSHAAANSSNDLPTVVDWVHLVAGGVWMGGLLQLLLVVLFVVPRLEDRAGFLGPLIRRFSIVAIGCVSVLVATGMFQSIERLGGVDELVETGYGSALLRKLVLLVPLLAFGAFNLLKVGPRVLALARGKDQGAVTTLWQGRFRRTVAAEVALAAGILVLTAILTNTSPPRGNASEEFIQTGGPVTTVESGDMSIAVWADPARVGTNDINVFLKDEDGDERTIQRVILRVEYLDQNLGIDEIDAEPLHPPSHYVANTSELSLAGSWEVEVIVRREGLRDITATIGLEISP